MSRAPIVAVAACLALVAGVVLGMPRDDRTGDGEVTGLLTSDEHTAAVTAGASRLTPAARAEIERVVAAGPTRIASPRSADPARLASQLVRCATFEGQRYCLHTGWTTAAPEQVQQRLAAGAAAADRARPVERTGDAATAALLRSAAALPPAQRAAAERRELTAAARSVAKVWLLRHQLEGVPLPDGFLDRHPEARAGAAAGHRVAARKTRGDYPARGVVMDPRRVAEQVRSYWCGPATMQMIAWGWQGEKRRQRHWAKRLGTTTSGSALSAMVRVTNRATGYDREDRAGKYIMLDVSDWSFKKWLLLQMRHIVDYRAPLILHPVLLKKYYPYLDDDASGHFQVGRGYDKNGRRPALLGYFEPWNQQRFDPSEPYIARVQWRSAYKSYRANQDHPHQNIGV